MNNKFWLLTLIVISALLLSACTINSHTIVNDTGTGSVNYELGFDQTDAETLQGLGQTPEEFCDSMNSEGDLPPGATITKEERSEGFYCIISVPFADLNELQELYGEGNSIVINQITLSDSQFVYDISVDGTGLSGDQGGADLGFTPQVSWKLTVPGTLGEHNADSAEGNTLTWDLSTGGVRNLQAKSSIGGLGLPGGNLGTIVAVLFSCLCCVILLAGAGGGIFWFTQRNKAKP